MTAIVPIEPGQWVLAYADGHFNASLSLEQNLSRLAFGGAGWELSERVAHGIFEVLQVTRVMPKTFRFEGVSYRTRGYRTEVIAAASSREEITILRSTLISIGFAADGAIAEETARRMADFTAKTRAVALAKVHAALPHIFGRST